MKYLSIFSGIEAATVAWEPLGLHPVAFAENERFPSAVLAERHPSVPNWGDVTKFRDWPDADVDVLVGGSPCQSFSVAGLRKGLADPRGNLALTFLAILDRYRPRWVLWENVPGVLSSDGGRDFGAFLGGLGQLGYGWGYRVLDAQYFGVPQRRRRVFVVGYLGDWRPPAAVLFEQESLRGDSAPRRETGEGVAPSLAARTRGGGEDLAKAVRTPTGGIDREDMHTLIAYGGNNTEGPIDVATASRAKGGSGHGDFESETFVTHSLRAEGFDASEDGTGRGTPLVATPIDTRNALRDPDKKDAMNRQGIGIGEPGDPSPTPTDAFTPAVAFSCKDHGADAGEVAPPLRAMGHDGSHANAGGQVAVAFTVSEQSNGFAWERPFALTLDSHPQSDTSNRQVGIRDGMAVRRLTPRECERLQGFPDSYTAIPWRGKPAEDCPDGPRYKALGNSMAVPVMRWLGERIQMVEDET